MFKKEENPPAAITSDPDTAAIITFRFLPHDGVMNQFGRVLKKASPSQKRQTIPEWRAASNPSPWRIAVCRTREELCGT